MSTIRRWRIAMAKLSELEVCATDQERLRRLTTFDWDIEATTEGFFQGVVAPPIDDVPEIDIDMDWWRD